MSWRDDLDRMAREFSRAFDDANALRWLAYGVVVALILSLLAGAFATMTRPRIYILGESHKEHG